MDIGLIVVCGLFLFVAVLLAFDLALDYLL